MAGRRVAEEARVCGVNLCVRRDGGPADTAWLGAANRALRHRGPDGSGQFARGSVGVGHTRLSIVDLTSGAQPLYSPDRSLVLVCNGEIYNSGTLRLELASRAHTFATRSDCEVLLHLYEEDPEGYLDGVAGMFAFILLDLRRNRVEIARDRIGIKPLFLHVSDRWILASSEMRTILAHPSVSPALDPQAIYDLLTFGFGMGPRTSFCSVREVPPATRVSYDLATGRLDSEEYWRPSFPGGSGGAAQFRDLLETVVGEHRLGDVPVGSYASGGLDSAILTAMLARQTRNRVPAFSLSFPGTRFDESEHIAELVRHTGVRGHRVPVTQWSLGDLERAVHALEQPQIVTLDIAHQHLSRATRCAGIKAVLAGDGADELLGGYDHFAVNAVRRAQSDSYGYLSTAGRERLSQALVGSAYPADFRDCYLDIVSREAPEVVEQFGTFPPWFVIWRLNDEIKRPLFGGGLTESLGDGGALEMACAPLLGDFQGMDDLDRTVWIEMRTRLPNWILWKSDRNGMRNSVEVRVPYLDHRVVDFLGTVPPSVRSRPGTTKAVLRHACADLLPERLLHRAKFAFNTPMEWLFLPEELGGAGEQVSQLLSPAAIRQTGIFEHCGVALLHKSVVEGVGRPSGLLHSLRAQVLIGVVTVQLLHRLFVAGGEPLREREADRT